MKETERSKCMAEHVEEQKRQTKRVTHRRKAHRDLLLFCRLMYSWFNLGCSDVDAHRCCPTGWDNPINMAEKLVASVTQLYD